MTLSEWFWLARAKMDQIKAEREAMDTSGNRKIHVPESEWVEMRAEHAAKMKEQSDG